MVGGREPQVTLFARPANLTHALDHLASGRWCILAGGTDIYPASVARPLNQPVLDISGLRELRGIEHSDDGWRLGALTRWSDVVDCDLPPAFDGLKLAAREIGGVQIQNVGTVAGNLCNASPAADGIPPLMTLDASVEVASKRGRRVVPLAAFILGNRKTAIAEDELVTAVLVPSHAGNGRSHFEKLGARRYLVISITMVAVRLVLEARRIVEARVAVGACSEAANRLSVLERDLIGARPEALASIVVEEHLAPLSPIDDIRASATYRRDAAFVLIGRSLQSAAGCFQ